MAIAEHVGREQIVSYKGQQWKLSRLERRHWDKFWDWAVTVLPNPVEVAIDSVLLMEERIAAITADAKIPAELKNAKIAVLKRQQDQASRLAQEAKSGYKQIGGPQVGTLLSSLEGSGRLIKILLEEHHPHLTQEDADAIVNQEGLVKVQKIIDRCAGLAPNESAPESASQAPGQPSTGTPSTGA